MPINSSSRLGLLGLAPWQGYPQHPSRRSCPVCSWTFWMVLSFGDAILSIPCLAPPPLPLPALLPTGDPRPAPAVGRAPARQDQAPPQARGPLPLALALGGSDSPARSGCTKPASEFGGGLGGEHGTRASQQRLRPRWALQPCRGRLSGQRSPDFRTAGSACWANFATGRQARSVGSPRLRCESAVSDA